MSWRQRVWPTQLAMYLDCRLGGRLTKITHCHLAETVTGLDGCYASSVAQSFQPIALKVVLSVECERAHP